MQSRFLLACIVVAGLLTSAVLLLSWPADSVADRARDLVVVVAVLGGAAYLIRHRSPRRITIDRVVLDDSRIVHTRGDGVVETVELKDLYGVDILTTSHGPFSEDVFLVLLGIEGKPVCVVPQGSRGFQELMKPLMALPDFDDKAVIQAMGSTSERIFRCWRRAPAA